MCVIRCAIQGIDKPASFRGLPFGESAFLCQHVVFRKFILDNRENLGFGSFIDVCDDVVGGFVINDSNITKPFFEDFPGFQCCSCGNFSCVFQSKGFSF